MKYYIFFFTNSSSFLQLMERSLSRLQVCGPQVPPPLLWRPVSQLYAREGFRLQRQRHCLALRQVSSSLAIRRGLGAVHWEPRLPPSATIAKACRYSCEAGAPLCPPTPAAAPAVVAHQLSRQMKPQLASRSFCKPVLSSLLLVTILIYIRVSASPLIMPLICSYIIFN